MHKVITLNETCSLNFRTNGKNHIISYKEQDFTNIKTLLEAVPEIVLKPLVAAEAVNFLTHGTLYEVEKKPSAPTIEKNYLSFFATTPSFQNILYKVTCEWPVITEHPIIKYTTRKASMFYNRLIVIS